jgi:hypothetical protein
MMQTQILTPSLETTGEDIGQELGAKMVKDFQDSFPTETQWFQMGRNIIEKILAQPECVGIRLYNGLDELGRKTLVTVGIDKSNGIIAEYSTINVDGKFVTSKGIVADRLTTRDNTGGSTISTSWFS